MRKIPAVPLITVDPYFSLWSADERLNVIETMHWTGDEKDFNGYVTVDGTVYAFLGYDRNVKKAKHISTKIGALNTTAVFEAAGIRFKVVFMTPVFQDNLKVMTRPVSYMSVSYESVDGKSHDVKVMLKVRQEVCLNFRKEYECIPELVDIEGTKTVKIGSSVQKILNRSGDRLCIDWGYFYLSTDDTDGVAAYENSYHHWIVRVEASVPADGSERLVLMSYDDIYSLQYFGDNIKSVWNSGRTTIVMAIKKALKEYKSISRKARSFDRKLESDARKSGGEMYARLLAHSFRQVMAAHKAACDKEGNILFVSKECFSNGCAATVDVSYPSIPMFLIYNPELIKGMMRPIYRFCQSDGWKYDFAPHDAGQYPLVNGQVYGLDNDTKELLLKYQMPVEECGNMIIMETNVAIATKDASFAMEHMDILKAWSEYLIKYGEDPAEQLCTDDFAGHLSHNCNLSLKAIMGIEGMSIIMNIAGNKAESEKYHRIAKKMADSWCVRAKDASGNYRLAFDQPGTFSLKYNVIWDKVWNTGLFPKEVLDAEVKCYLDRMNEYGTPLDSRSDCTKSDWLVWSATLADNREDFIKLIEPLDRFYKESPSRVPMTDWFDTVSGYQIAFQNRTVQGGLYMKLLCDSGKLRVK